MVRDKYLDQTWSLAESLLVAQDCTSRVHAMAALHLVTGETDSAWLHSLTADLRTALGHAGKAMAFNQHLTLDRHDVTRLAKDTLAALESVLQNGDWSQLHSLTRDTNPILWNLAEFAQRTADEKEKAVMQKVQQDERDKRLTSDQKKARHMKGLLKWAIGRVMAETGDTATPAAGLLLDRLGGKIEPLDSLNETERQVYWELKTVIEGTRTRQAINEIMADGIAAIPWENVTIRL